MRKELVLLSLLLCAAVPASAQVGLSIRTPTVSIGIHVPLYPRLVAVPNYPVYYAPELDSNYFFYDGEYWVYQDDNWYASDWYDGPWELVEPEDVPLFILRVPVRYYRLPPRYFIGWRQDAPPRWHDHWGNGWAQRHSGWDRWDRRSVPSRAPLPIYQRQYSGDRYPHRVEQQHTLRTQHYNYRPREEVVRHRFEQPQRTQNAPVQGRPAQQEARQSREPRGDSQRDRQRTTAPRPSAPPVQQPPVQQTEQRARQREQPPSREHREGPRRDQRDNEDRQKDHQEQKSNEGQDRARNDDRGKDDERGRGGERGRERR